MSAATARPARPAFHPLMLLPGMAFWAAAGYGIVTGNELVLGLAVGAVLVALAVGFVRMGRRSAAERAELLRIWVEGARGRARILRIEETGASFNDHPQVAFDLEVTDPEGRTFRAQATSYVRTIAIPRIQPGCELEVGIDPADPGRVALDEAVVYPGYRS